MSPYGACLAVAFWVTGCFIKEAAVTKSNAHAVLPGSVRALRIYVLLSAGHQQNHSVSSAIFNSMQPIWVFLISALFFLHEKATVMKIIGIALGFGGAMLYPDAGQRFGTRCVHR